MAKAMVSCLVDCGKSMHEKCDDQTPYSKLSIASTVVQSLLTHIIMNYKTAEFSLVTLGGVPSQISEVDAHKHSSVEEIVPMSRVNTTVLSTVQDMFKLQQQHSPSTSTKSKPSCCYTDGLGAALDVLTAVNVGKSFHRILLFITDGESPIEKFERLEGDILPKLIQHECSLYIAFIGNKNNNNSCIHPDMAEIKWENSSLFQSIVSVYNHSHHSSNNELSNKKATKSISHDGKFVQSNQPDELLSLFINSPGLSTTPRATKIHFTMGNIKIPCQYYASVSKQSLPSLKKVSKSFLSNHINEIKEGGVGGFNNNNNNNNNGTVKRDTSYRNPDAPDEEIFNENKVKGYKYGSQYVPFNSTEENLFKLEGPAGIELIGFLPREKVPHYHYLGATNILQGDNRLISAQLAILNLSKAMRKKGQVALVRFVKKDDADPYLAALIPKSFDDDDNDSDDDDGKMKEDGTLLIQQLPCMEDVREYDFPPLPTPPPSSSSSSLSSSSSSSSTIMTNAFDNENINQQKLSIQQKQSLCLKQVIDAMTVKKLPRTFLPPYNYSQQCVRAAIRSKLYKLLHTRSSSSSSSFTTNASKNSNNNTTTSSASSSSSLLLPTMEAPFQDPLDPSYVFTHIIAPHLQQAKVQSHADNTDDPTGSTGTNVGTTTSNSNSSSSTSTSSSISSITELYEKIKQLSDVFNLTYRDPNQTKKRIFWSDVQLTGSSGDGAGGGEAKESAASKKARGQVKITIKDDQLDAAATRQQPYTYTGPVLSSGSVNPSEEFTAIMDYLSNMMISSSSSSSSADVMEQKKDDDDDDKNLRSIVKTIFRQNAATLQDIIVRLVATGGTAAYYRKAVQCIKTYRIGAIKFNESDTYNAFLSTVIKPSFSPYNSNNNNNNKYSAFWELLKSEPNQTTLINQDEDSYSSYVSNDTASTQFFDADVIVESTGEEVNETIASEVNDDDDIFADLA